MDKEIEQELLEEETLDVEYDDVEDDEEESDDKDRRIKELEGRLAKSEQAIVKNKMKAKEPKEAKSNYSNNQAQRDLLRFNGVPADEIDYIEKVASLEGIDLIDAKNSELFTNWKEKKDKDLASKGASLPGSNRSIKRANTIDQVKERVAKTNSFTKDDIKKMVHGN